MATSNPSFMRRVEDFKPSKTMLFWFGAACAVATMVVGFSWGGWVTGGTATQLSSAAADDARANLAAAYCVTQFKSDPAEATQLISQSKIDRWERASFIAKGGWATLPGTKDPVSGAAELCSQQLADMSVPAADAGTVSK